MILRNIVSRLFVHLVFNCSNFNVIFRTYVTFYLFPIHYGNTHFYHFNCIDKYLPLGGAAEIMSIQGMGEQADFEIFK